MGLHVENKPNNSLNQEQRVVVQGVFPTRETAINIPLRDIHANTSFTPANRLLQVNQVPTTFSSPKSFPAETSSAEAGSGGLDTSSEGFTSEHTVGGREVCFSTLPNPTTGVCTSNYSKPSFDGSKIVQTDDPKTSRRYEANPEKQKLSLDEVIEYELKSPGDNSNVAQPQPAVKISILERALTEALPEHEINKADHINFGYPSNYDLDVQPSNVDDGSQLYNPKKSPLKNRTEILCDLLGING